MATVRKYRGKYPARVASVSSISLFPGRYMLVTNAGDKYTVDGRALDAVADHLKADVSAFPGARLLTATACERGADHKALSVTLTYADGETVTHTPEDERKAKSFNICQLTRDGWKVVNPAPYGTFRAAREDRDLIVLTGWRMGNHDDRFQIFSVAVCNKNQIPAL